MQHKRFIITDKILLAEFYVQLGGCNQKAVDWFGKATNGEKFQITNPHQPSGSFFQHDQHKGGCIWIRDRKDLPSLVHEVTHATQYLLRRLRVELREDTEEVFCYHIQWLLSEIVKKGKLKIK